MNGLLQRIWEKRVTFLAVFFFVFTITYIVLVLVDFLPEPPAEDGLEQSGESQIEAETLDPTGDATMTLEPEPTETAIATSVEPVLPISISIERIGKTVPVLNPTSRTIADLDAALLDGVVRHPDSATLSQEGNVFILGHSSYLPNVMNPNFQAFNGIQDLEWGDTIELTTEEEVYEYRVERVYRARAQDVTVPIADTGNMLTLATCNSFGSVDDRYIVEAKRIGSETL